MRPRFSASRRFNLGTGIYAVGRLEFAAEFAQEDAERTGRSVAVVRDSEVRIHLIEAKIFLAYQRQLNNLSIQESRLRRQREKDTAALRNLQQLRRQQQAKRLTEAARQYIQAVHEERNDIWEPDENGFEFSIAEVEVRALEIEPDLFAEWAEANAAAENAA